MVPNRHAGEIDDEEQYPRLPIGPAAATPDMGQATHRSNGEGCDGVDLGLVRVLPVGKGERAKRCRRRPASQPEQPGSVRVKVVGEAPDRLMGNEEEEAGARGT